MSADHPEFLYVQAPAGEAGENYMRRIAGLAAVFGGRVLASATGDEVEGLEPGTPASACCLLQFDDHASLDELWQSREQQALLSAVGGNDELLVLKVPGLPYAGLPELPDIPTTASVTPPDDDETCAYMIIQGTTFDQDRMDGYRDIILPMIKALSAYYIAFDLDGNVTALSGSWPHQIFAISRWPNHGSGHQFWHCDRYQNVAIPQRQGAGEFTVHYLSALDFSALESA